MTLAGELLVHPIRDGANAKVFKNWTVMLKCDTWPEVQTLFGYLGRSMYFIPNYHDSAAHNSYTQAVFVDSVREVHIKGPTIVTTAIVLHLTDRR